MPHHVRTDVKRLENHLSTTSNRHSYRDQNRIHTVVIVRCDVGWPDVTLCRFFYTQTHRSACISWRCYKLRSEQTGLGSLLLGWLMNFCTVILHTIEVRVTLSLEMLLCTCGDFIGCIIYYTGCKLH